MPWLVHYNMQCVNYKHHHSVSSIKSLFIAEMQHYLMYIELSESSFYMSVSRDWWRQMFYKGVYPKEMFQKIKIIV